jgi:hypothetical protein
MYKTAKVCAANRVLGTVVVESDIGGSEHGMVICEIRSRKRQGISRSDMTHEGARICQSTL